MFIRDLYRKRAYANLTTKHFDAVLEDVLASCSGASSDSKAYYCAGRASYELTLFEESKAHFERALEPNPKDLKSRKEYNRAITRIGEKESGKYDLSTMVRSVKPWIVRISSRIPRSARHTLTAVASSQANSYQLVVCFLLRKLCAYPICTKETRLQILFCATLIRMRERSVVHNLRCFCSWRTSCIIIRISQQDSSIWTAATI